MKTLEMNNYGVQEMNANEMKEVDGGSVILFLLGVAVGILVYHITVNITE